LVDYSENVGYRIRIFEPELKAVVTFVVGHVLVGVIGHGGLAGMEQGNLHRQQDKHEKSFSAENSPRPLEVQATLEESMSGTSPSSPSSMLSRIFPLYKQEKARRRLSMVQFPI
jgi:hypothetical protein